MNRLRTKEEGAAGVLSIGLIAVLLLVAGLASVLGLAVAARHRVGSAADAAALAAADTASGATGGIPCERAAETAAAGGAELAECGQQGLCASVEVRLAVLGIEVHARARAGPPGSVGGCQAADRLRGAVDAPVYGVRDRRPPQRIRAAGSREGKGGRPCPAPRSS